MVNPIILILGVAAFLVMLGAGVVLLTGGGQGDVEERLEEFVATETVFGC